MAYRRAAPDAYFPAQTPAPSPSPTTRPRSWSPKRRRLRDLENVFLSSRQTVADQSQIAEAQNACEFDSGNDVISCFPDADTVVPQHEWTAFVWNSRRPELTQTNSVDIFLFRGDSRRQVLNFTNVPNPTNQAGILTAQVNDTWWGADGVKWNGGNVSYPFYWVIQRSDAILDGNQIAQPTFTAVQTTYADSVVASRSAAASASLRSASLARASELASHSSSASQPGSSGSVQHASNESAFPHWAIAVIVVLGFFAIVLLGILAFIIIRRVKRKNREELESNRNSMGSASPMMAHGGPTTPLLASAAALQPPHGGPLHPTSGTAPPASAGTAMAAAPGASSVALNDGASTISRSGSAGDAGPFSGADAAIMADAFRKMLRKPDFAAEPVDECESPEHPEEKTEMISRELAEEGRGIRHVGSSRGVRVETMSDDGPEQDSSP